MKLARQDLIPPGAPGKLRPVAPEHIHVPYTEDRPATTGSNHRHWVIQAFHHWEGDQMIDTVVVEVEAMDEQEAWARAMEIIQRPYYRTSTVREICTKDTALKGEN